MSEYITYVSEMLAFSSQVGIRIGNWDWGGKCLDRAVCADRIYCS